MDTQFLLNLISRWLHILPAIVLVGGTLFMRLALLPKPGEQIDDASAATRLAARRRWAKWVGICTLLLLLSGLYNAYVKATTLQLSGAYNGLMLVKIILAFAVFWFSALLAGKSKRAVAFQSNERKSLNLVCVLMLLIVLIAGWMKTASGTFFVKVRDSEPAEVVTESEQPMQPSETAKR